LNKPSGIKTIKRLMCARISSQLPRHGSWK